MQIKRDKVKKILCIKPRGIGDVLLSTVVFDNLRRDFPDAAIDYLTEPPGAAVIEELPFINEIVLLDKSRKMAGLEIIRKVRKRKYDLVLDFYANPRTAIITFLSSAGYRAGYPFRGRKYAYNLYGPSERGIAHAAEMHLEFLKSIGLSAIKSPMYLGLDDDDLAYADKYWSEKFDKNDFVIGLFPGGGWQSKKCDPVKFAEIGDAAARKYNAKIIIFWGPDDKDDAAQIKKLMSEPALLAEPMSLRQTAAGMRKCTFMIMNDSGPMHMAAAVGTPVLALFGPTDPYQLRPYGDMHEWVRNEGLACLDCKLLECPYNHECFMELPVANVIEKTELLVKKNGLV